MFAFGSLGNNLCTRGMWGMGLSLSLYLASLIYGSTVIEGVFVLYEQRIFAASVHKQFLRLV